jgi:hypothetical protein
MSVFNRISRKVCHFNFWQDRQDAQLGHKKAATVRFTSKKQDFFLPVPPMNHQGLEKNCGQ